ncbi:hypothetical protein ON010_g12697 [Phytophthora cinnamomi]|nr:hypothetical protein ON010_g12697 [Phytophthora cinnamomi]
MKHQKTDVPAEAEAQSRFGFARAPAPPLPSAPAPVPVPAEQTSTVDTDSQPRSKSVPPGRSAPPPGLFNASEGESPDSVQGTGSFNFDDFAKSIQISGPAPPVSAPMSQPPQQPPQPLQPPQPQQQQQFLNQQQQGQGVFGRPMPPMPNGQFANGPPRYPMPPMMPQQNPMYFAQGNMPPGPMQPRGYPQPPPPPPPSNNGGGAFDVASLAMQFHNSGASNGSSGFGAFGAPRPPMGYPPNGQQLFPGMPPPPFGMPPPPPQSTFKPSMSYTSVTTTRQKK